MWYKLCLFASIIALTNSCQQSSQNPKSEEYGESNSAKTDNVNARADSLEDLADKMRDEGASEVESAVKVATAFSWTADKNLRTIRRVTLTNNSNEKVVGIKLVYIMPIGKSADNRDLGKFKIDLNPSKTVVLKIPAKRFRVSDDIIESGATSHLMFPDSVVASVIYFENGEVETHNFPIGFQHKE